MAYGPIGQVNGMSYVTIEATSSASISYVQVTQRPTQILYVGGGSVNGGASFLKVFDSPTLPTTGAQAALLFVIPGNAAGAGTNANISQSAPIAGGLQINTGLSIALTANIALNDVSGIGGGGVYAVVGFN